ncbi:MAG: sensor histidine kinase [Kiritimatiellia bacterium]
MATQIAWRSFVSFGLLAGLSAALVLGVTIHHHTHDYHAMLARITGDLASEYAACRGDREKMKAFFEVDTEEHGHGNVFLLISDAQNQIVVEEAASASILTQMLARAHDAHPRTYRIERDRRDELGRPIAVRVRKTPFPDGNVLSVGYNVTADESHMMRIALALGLSIIMILGMSRLFGVLLARRFTRPLRQLADAARKIGSGDYSARIPPTNEGWEIADLENAFNTMSAQNERTLMELHMLTDNIAHDLRTPLTRLRLAAELDAMAETPRRSLPELVSKETGDMLDMINTMLEISQTSHGIDRTPREILDLAAFVRNTAELYATLAEDNGQRLVVHVPDSPVPFSGHKGKLQQLLGNLLDNAVKFTPRNGEIVVSLRADPVTLAVSNTGPGIAAADIPHVFKRFWRADSSRTLPGNGLGLALAKAIATSYGAGLVCASANGLTTFTFTEAAAIGQAEGAGESRAFSPRDGQ